MPLYKTSKADLRGKYKRNLKVSLAVALIFMVAAFKFSPQKSKHEKQIKPNIDIITVINTLHTNQPKTPPRIKPLVPEITLNSEIEEIEFKPTEIDIYENIPKPPERTEVHKTLDNENIIFKAVENPPEPEGGIAAIQKKIHYTDLALRVGIQGKVIVLAIINENGDVISASIAKSLLPSLDEIALNAVKDTKFIPGKQRGKPVKVQVAIPITFKLQ